MTSARTGEGGTMSLKLLDVEREVGESLITKTSLFCILFHLQTIRLNANSA